MHPDVCMVSQERLNGVGFVAAHVIADHVNISFPAGCADTTSVRNATNWTLIRRGAVLPSTSPVKTFNAANKLKVPFH